jgi:protein-L-isoaspartate(D-aspartate) O-methyltransferase
MIRTQLRARGIRDERVLNAMAAVPRDRFVPSHLSDKAFDDCALPIEHDQTISQPYIVALMTEALNTQPHHRILEIGTGSGYQAAVLSRLCARVYTIERHAALSDSAADRLNAVGIDNVMFRVGDGTLGWPDEAPFDGIIVTAGAPVVPDELVAQLAPTGRLVIPVGSSEQQTLLLIQVEAGQPLERRLTPCRFVKLIGAQGWKHGDD